MKFLSYFTLVSLSLYSTVTLAIEPTGVADVKPVIDPLSGTNLVQVIAGLLFVLILVVAIAWLLRRVGGVSLTGSSSLSVIGGMSMGARERVVLLQVGDEQLLIGVSPGRIQKLHVLENPIEVQSSSGEQANFAVKLAEALRGKSK